MELRGCKRCCKPKEIFTVCLDCYGEVVRDLEAKEQALDDAARALQLFEDEFAKHQPTYEKSKFSGEWHYSPISGSFRTETYFKIMKYVAVIQKLRRK